jgi:hypothetical protein
MSCQRGCEGCCGLPQDAMIMGADYYESDKQQEELRAAG